jgi:hypothetical protein
VKKTKRNIKLKLYIIFIFALQIQGAELLAQPGADSVTRLYIEQPPARTDSAFHFNGDFCNCNPANLAAPASRKTDLSALDKYYGNKEFQYERTLKDEAGSFWQNLIQRILRKLFGNIKYESRVKVQRIIYWLIALVGVVIVFYWLYKSGFSGSPIRRNRKISDGSLISETEKSDEDIGNEIEQALQAGNYPLAIRWVFIKTIKLMALEGQIELRQDKTNQDYYYEIKNNTVQSLFMQLSRLFEYTNYGQFETTRDNYQQAQDISGKISTGS